MTKRRTIRIKRISVSSWRPYSTPYQGSCEQIYEKRIKGRQVSIISVSPSIFPGDTTVRVSTSGGIFGVRDAEFKTDEQANAYARKAMMHINRTIKEFGY